MSFHLIHVPIIIALALDFLLTNARLTHRNIKSYIVENKIVLQQLFKLLHVLCFCGFQIDIWKTQKKSYVLISLVLIRYHILELSWENSTTNQRGLFMISLWPVEHVFIESFYSAIKTGTSHNKIYYPLPIMVLPCGMIESS